MVVLCPQCGGGNVRQARMRTPSELLASLVGVHPLRCRDCRHRFATRTWKLADISYARCPKCLNMRLTTWSPSHYHVPLGRGLLLLLGGSPYRCDSCRQNFVSLRRRKYKRSR
jgi:ssDNA-binding Zn-finger/Zn-ribbon topoisomerase 1